MKAWVLTDAQLSHFDSGSSVLTQPHPGNHFCWQTKLCQRLVRFTHTSRGPGEEFGVIKLFSKRHDRYNTRKQDSGLVEARITNDRALYFAAPWRKCKVVYWSFTPKATIRKHHNRGVACPHTILNLARYINSNIKYIIGLSQVRWTGIGETTTKQDKIWYSGHPNKHEQGVACIVNRQDWGAYWIELQYPAEWYIFVSEPNPNLLP